MTTHTKYLTAFGLAAVLALGGCWDGDDDDTPPTVITAVPDSAGVSAAAFVSFLQTLGEDELSEPLSIPTDFAVPADETS